MHQQSSSIRDAQSHATLMTTPRTKNGCLLVCVIGWHSNKYAVKRTWQRNMRSKVWWFTEFCNSHYISHFAVFFIVARAKISVVKSCFELNQVANGHWLQWRFKDKKAHHQIQVVHLYPMAETNSSTGLVWIGVNDPSAGSPTETLLRLLLPLDDKV